MCFPNKCLPVFLFISVCILCVGCVEQDSAVTTMTSENSDFANPEDEMFTLVSEEAVYQVLRNVDRPLETEFEKPLVNIPPEDPTIAYVAVYCTFMEKGLKKKLLFFIMFENIRSPGLALTKKDLTCLLVNAGGKVLDRDEEYWSGVPEDLQVQSGAVDGDTPPFIARTMLDFSRL